MRLTVKQAAELAGVSASLIYNLCAAKKIRHERHGMGRGRILIPEDALAEYCQRCTVEVAAAVPPRPKKKVTLKHLHLPS